MKSITRTVASMTVATMAVLATAMPTFAETRPANQEPTGGSYVSSYDSRIPFAPDTYGFPQTLIGRVPDALAQQAHARMMLMRAHSSLSGTFAKMRFTFDRSADYRAVANEEKAAFTAYQSARDAAMDKLAKDDNYRAVIELRDEMGDRIVALQKVKDITAADLVPLAEEKMNYSRTASAMEAKALAEDRDVTAARDRFVAAGAKLAQAKVTFDDSLRYHPDVEAARNNLADARVAVVTTAAYSTGLLKASHTALDYAYYLQRDRAIGGATGYGYDSGYGYGRYNGNYGLPYRYYGYGYSK